MRQAFTMPRILIGLGIFLIAWGAVVLITGNFVATLDIGAGLVAWGVGVIAMAAIVRALGRIADALDEHPEDEAEIAEAPQTQAAAPPVAMRAAEPAARPAPETEEPELVREGVIEGRRYRFFSDGSIEAEGPRGVKRYRSIDEAREQILRDRAAQEAQAPEAEARQERPPFARERENAPRAPRIADEGPAAERRTPPPPRPAAPPPREASWDSYLTARKDKTEPAPDPAPAAKEAPPVTPPTPASDDEWSEPFRSILKGGGPEDDPNRRR